MRNVLMPSGVRVDVQDWKGVLNTVDPGDGSPVTIAPGAKVAELSRAKVAPGPVKAEKSKTRR